jgi:ankyrin repeat protein
LLEASFQGHLDIVRLLLEKGADLRARVVRKNSRGDDLAPDDALSMAVLGNHPQVIKFLVSKGARMDGAYGSKVWTPNGEKGRPLLLVAIIEEKEDAACALVEAGVNIEAQQEDYETQEDKEPSEIASALTLASARGYSRLVKLLLERDIHGDNRLRRYFFREALKGAAGEGHVAVFNALVAAAPSLADSFRLPLAGAAINGDRPEIVDLLVRRGLVPDEPGSDDVSPIVAAAAGLQPKALAALLRSRPQTASSGGRRWTAQLNQALLKAAPYLGNRRTGDTAQLDRIEVVRLLLDAGAAPDARNDSGHSALYMAGAEVTLLLLGAGADPNQKTKDGETPIHRALLDEQWYRVMVLAQNGADVNVPLPYAIGTYAQLEAQVTGKDSEKLPNASEKGATPLHIASANCVDKLVQVLLKKGANARGKDGAGRTPLQVTTCDEVKTLLRNAK